MCQLTLLEDSGTIHFVVKDNGVGRPIREGNGLRGMRERLKAVNGSVKLTSSATGGTSITITLPPNTEAQPPSADQFAGEVP